MSLRTTKLYEYLYTQDERYRCNNFRSLKPTKVLFWKIFGRADWKNGEIAFRDLITVKDLSLHVVGDHRVRVRHKISSKCARQYVAPAYKLLRWVTRARREFNKFPRFARRR